MNNQFPHNIPPPKYNFFDFVDSPYYKGYVIGMTFIPPSVRDDEGHISTGWDYLLCGHLGYEDFPKPEECFSLTCDVTETDITEVIEHESDN